VRKYEGKAGLYYAGIQHLISRALLANPGRMTRQMIYIATPVETKSQSRIVNGKSRGNINLCGD
jgi:hypothetical protein